MTENELSSSGLAGEDQDELSGAAVDFSTRCMAMVIDGVFLAGLVGCTLFLFVRTAMVLPPADWHSLVFLLIFSIVSLLAWPLLLSAFYFIVLHSFGGQTLGKVFMGIMVVSDEGRMLSLGASFLRLSAISCQSCRWGRVFCGPPWTGSMPPGTTNWPAAGSFICNSRKNS